MTTKRESLASLPVVQLTGVKSSRVIGNNTFEVVYGNDTRTIRLHKTDILTFLENGSVILNSGRWRTVTTRSRINEHLNYAFSGYLWKVYQFNRVWYVNTPLEKKVLFYDGIIFDKDGRLLSLVLKEDKKGIASTKQKIATFVKLVDSLEKIPLPDGGDCWSCLAGNDDCIESHVEEGYLHGSLIVRALREKGYRDNQLPYIIGNGHKEAIKRALRRYLGKRLLKELAY